MRKHIIFAVMAFAFPCAGADTVVTIQESYQSVSPSVQEWKFDVPPFSVEHQVRLSLEARIDRDRLAGSTYWLQAAVNGTFLTKGDLLNKRNDFKTRGGLDLSWTKGSLWRVLYSPDFQAAIVQVDSPSACPDADPYRFVWDITPYCQPGKNLLQVRHQQALSQPATLVLRNIQVEVGKTISPPAAEPVVPAPTGAVPTFVAKGPQQIPMQVALSSGGAIRLVVAGEALQILTRTSLPNAAWHEPRPDDRETPARPGSAASVTWRTPLYRVERQVTVRSDHLHVADTITGLSDELIGVIVEHRLSPANPPAEVRLGGRVVVGESSRTLNPAHPSVFAQWKGLGLGLVAEDDVFRVHALSFKQPEGMGLIDDKLGIQPSSSVTLEWSIYPVAGDYWDFVNAVRRNWDTNFTIPGPFCFVASQHEEPWSAEQWGDWMHRRGLRIVSNGIPKYKNGRYAHGTGIEHAPEWVAVETEWVKKVHAGAPDVTTVAYLHAQISSEPGGEEKYADSRLIDARGEHLGYPYRYRLPIYLPTRDNSYGKALWGYVRTCLDTIGVDGLYWDEMSHSVLWFAEQAPWDGVTVKINPQTHALVGKWTSVPLLMQPLKLDIIRHVRERGKFLMGNGQPATRTMTRQKIVRFVETGSYSAVANTHLGCPIGLSNHQVEKTHEDSARGVREILRYGGVYYGHTYYRDPAPWNFTEVMFPITPVELYEGVVLGEERIHTARSGRFGWPDGAAAEVYVVDAHGARAARSLVKEIIEGDKRLYEIRMPSDHFAILVKRGAGR